MRSADEPYAQRPLADALVRTTRCFSDHWCQTMGSNPRRLGGFWGVVADLQRYSCAAGAGVPWFVRLLSDPSAIHSLRVSECQSERCRLNEGRWLLEGDRRRLEENKGGV